MSDNFDSLKDNEFYANDEQLEKVSGGNGENCFVYIIKWGDTLPALAQRYGTTVARLCEINNIKNPNKIYAGNKLYIPYRD